MTSQKTVGIWYNTLDVTSLEWGGPWVVTLLDLEVASHAMPCGDTTQQKQCHILARHPAESLQDPPPKIPSTSQVGLGNPLQTTYYDSNMVSNYLYH